MTTIQQLRDIRKALPMGKKDPWGKCCPSKRILFQRALKKETVAELTLGEQEVVTEFLNYYKSLKQENLKFEKTILNATQQ